nr:sugar kinase [Microbacterium testaceum]
MGSVLTFGETMALVTAQDLGSWETVSHARVSIGGADSNVAIGLARLGVSVRWIGRVGDDALGRRVERDIRSEGVDTRAITDGSGPTGVMFKERRTPAHTRVSFYRSGSAGSRLVPSDISDDDIARAEVVLVNGVTASLSDTAEATALSVASRAKAAGTTVAFDVNHRPSLWIDRDPRPLYLEIARHADVLFAGEEEARLLRGDVKQSSREALRRLSDIGPSEVVLKSGARGAMTLVAGRVIHQRAVPITPVDTVGAGDAFVAGYLAERIAGGDHGARLERGTQCGAFACLGPGDWESLPRRADLTLLAASDPVDR